VYNNNNNKIKNKLVLRLTFLLFILQYIKTGNKLKYQINDFTRLQYLIYNCLFIFALLNKKKIVSSLI